MIFSIIFRGVWRHPLQANSPRARSHRRLLMGNMPKRGFHRPGIPQVRSSDYTLLTGIVIELLSKTPQCLALLLQLARRYLGQVKFSLLRQNDKPVLDGLSSIASLFARSEERRVGRECRCRWE